LKIKASVKAMIGVGHAKALKAFTTDGDKAQKAAQTARKRSRCGGGSSSVEADAAALVAKWDVTSFFSLPPQQRWRVIKDVQHRYKELCVDDPKQRLEAHDEAAVGRLQDARRDETNKARNRWLIYKNLEPIIPVTTPADLEALYSSFAHEDDAGRDNAMIDQISVRVHIYSAPAKDLPNMHGAGGHKINAERLLLELPTPVGFDGALSPKPKAPSPCPARK